MNDDLDYKIQLETQFIKHLVDNYPMPNTTEYRIHHNKVKNAYSRRTTLIAKRDEDVLSY